MNAAPYRALILARLLTRAGDHAWGLAIPLALLIAAPGTFRALAAYYLLTRLAIVIAMPLFGRWIDEADRLAVVRTGILLQAAGVLAAAALLQRAPLPDVLPSLILIIAAGIVSQIGASMMNVVLPGRWVPALFSGDALARINAHLKQCDLASEVVAPVAAGALMAAASSPSAPYRGFHLVALLNLLSFALEYVLLARVYRAAPGFAATAAPSLTPAPPSAGAVRTFLAQPALPVLIAYALLWFTVLTPHGAILTSYLSLQWKLDEQLLGLVRGVGALCGLVPTLVYPRLVATLSLRGAATACLHLQLASLVIACLALASRSTLAATAFIVALMISRIGLYGFVLAQVQIFQESVPDDVRGRVGAVAWAFNNALGLAIYGAALVFSDPAQFPLLAWATCGSVGLAALLVTAWALR